MTARRRAKRYRGRRDSWLSDEEHDAVERFREAADLHANSAGYDVLLFAHGAGRYRPGAEAVRVAYARARAVREKSG